MDHGPEIETNVTEDLLAQVAFIFERLESLKNEVSDKINETLNLEEDIIKRGEYTLEKYTIDQNRQLLLENLQFAITCFRALEYGLCVKGLRYSTHSDVM